MRGSYGRPSIALSPSATSSSWAQVVLQITHRTRELQVQKELRVGTQSTAGEILPGPDNALDVFLHIRSQLLNESFLKKSSTLERAVSLHHSVWMNTLRTKKLEQLPHDLVLESWHLVLSAKVPSLRKLYLHNTFFALNVKLLIDEPSDEHANHFAADMSEAEST